MVSASLLATAVLAGLGVASAGAAYWYYEQSQAERREAFDAVLDEVDEGEPIEFSAAEVSAGVGGLLATWRHRARATRLAKKGYVKWYRLDSTLGRPTWVKPTQDGAGVPKATVGGQPYYFPKDAMVADATTGAWVALHREGDGDPINLRDPAYPGLEADLVERTINLEAEDKPPGFFDNLFGSTDQTTLMYLSIGVLFLLYAAYQYSTGAL